MENRDAIVRKLNALRAKFEHGTTNEAEASSAMNKYNELMAKYRLTEDDLGIANSKINVGEFFTNKHGFQDLAPLCWLIKPISMVTETKGVCHGKVTGLFFGLAADVQYAEFLWSRCNDSLNAAINAYEVSPNFKKYQDRGFQDNEIRTAFISGWLQRMTAKLIDMVPENRCEKNALILLKNDLIEQALGDAAETKNSGAIVKYGATVMHYEGGLEAEKVRLRQEAEAKTKYLGVN
jgi:hypothetical protein